MMRRTTLTTSATVSCLACTSAPSPKQGPRPNIVLTLTNGQGWQDTSEPFADERTPQNDLYRTPSTERLLLNS